MALNQQQLARLKEITEHVKINSEFFDSILSIGMFTLPMLPTVKAELEAKAKAERERVNKALTDGTE
jgi:hypothetical protein